MGKRKVVRENVERHVRDKLRVSSYREMIEKVECQLEDNR